MHGHLNVKFKYSACCFAYAALKLYAVWTTV